MKYQDKDELRQLLLELHYDLLDPEQAAQLRKAIESDADVASEWANTLRVAGKLAVAAKLDGVDVPKVDLEGTKIDAESNGRTEQGAVLQSPSTIDPAEGKRTQTWWLNTTAIAGLAAAIGMLVIGSWYLDRMPASPQAVVSVRAVPVSPEQADTDNEFQFITSRMDGSSPAGFAVAPATLAFSVWWEDSVLFAGTTKTDRDGKGRIKLPADLVIPESAKLKITAKGQAEELSQSSLEIPLEPTRCLTYLTVDRPVYRPGETVFFRSLTLQRRSLRANNDVPIRYELIDPSGAVVAGAFTEGVTDRGVGNGAFNLPSTVAGGSFKLVAKSLDGFFPDEECKFQVRAYRVPRFKKSLEFDQRSYGPGDRVEATFEATRAEGGPLSNAQVKVSAMVDDKVIYQLTTRTSNSGSCQIAFDLPSLIVRGRGQLSVLVDDGGTQETQSETLPIQLGQVMVDFYPEGGYLVDGLKNRVYFCARDTLGNPIHIEGEILDRSGNSVATVNTTRDGMGQFAFAPRFGDRYSLKVSRPLDVTNSPKLPAPVKDLPVIDTGVGVFAKNQPITMSIRTKTARPVIVRAVLRGRLVGEAKHKLTAGDNSIALPVRPDTDGVVRVTILDSQSLPHRPLVERLVFCRNDRKLQVEVVDEESALQRSPGESLRLTLQVRDETGEPTPAVLGVSVVDDAALSLDDAERPDLRTHFLLTSEIEKPEDLEHANFYLEESPDAEESLDLLLGTQGWRRFISGSPAQASVDFREQLIRLLELDGDHVSRTTYNNSGNYTDQWIRYEQLASNAWQRLLRETRVLMLVILFAWLAIVLFQIRRQAKLNVAAWFLVASTSLFLYGCGGSSTTMIEGNASESASFDQSYERDMAQAGALPEMPTSVAPEPTIAAEASGPIPEALNMVVDAVKKLQESPDASFRFADANATRKGTNSVHDANDAETLSDQELKKLLAARGIDAAALADQLLDELRFPVRQYAHRHKSTTDGVREDFAETLLWNPLLITDSEGRATVRFDLSDSVTSFLIRVDGHTNDGRIGSGSAEIGSRIPFQIEPKVPLEVTTGDRIDLPIAVINSTEEDSEVSLLLKSDPALQPSGETTKVLQLSAGERRREYVTLNVVKGASEQDAMIEVRGSGTGSLSDSLRRKIHISPVGYPEHKSLSGRLSGREKIQLPLPQEIVPGSLAVTVRAFPSPLADVMSGVESILREPSGCFEQTSATNYPNAMALLYLRENETTNPEVSQKALGMLDRGYQKLISFECDRLGFEWFGDDPGHEALSAFGLMQFTDMSRVMVINAEMMSRTRQWLLARRDGNGGFQRNPRHLHTWSVQQAIVNAYVLWAITEADVAAGQPRRATSELSAELSELTRVAQQSKDPYLIGLSAATLLNVGHMEVGQQLLKKLAKKQKEDGSLTGNTTVTSSGGISRTMETTAIAALAWVKDPQYLDRARAAVSWISQNRIGTGGFGSTQATVLALKALVAMAGHSQTATGGELTVHWDGKMIGKATLPQDPQSGSTVEIKGLGQQLELGKRDEDIELELLSMGSRNLNYSIELAYHAITPTSDKSCPLKISTQWVGDFATDKIPGGELVAIKTRLENLSAKGLPMTIAIVGLPGGVEPRHEELDELREAGHYDFYEVRGREVVFYWRTIAPSESKEIDFHVTAAVPGKYTGPASRTYLYYTAEQKHWTEPLAIEIEAR